MKHDSITKFLDSEWSEEYPTLDHYIIVDVVYPECSVQQLLFNENAYKNFKESLEKPESEVKRIVWNYFRK